MAARVLLVRHGKTPYHELTNHGFNFNSYAHDLRLSPDFLDLTTEGIEECSAAAMQLISILDPERPVWLGTSPQWRAQSSLLVIEDALRRTTRELPQSPRTGNVFLPLRNIALRPDFDPTQWMSAHGQWKANPENANRLRHHPHLVHQYVIEEILRPNSITVNSITDVFAETHQDVDRRVRNLLKYLLSEDRQWVITCHEESVGILLETLGVQTGFQNGQILEFRAKETF